MRWTSQASQAPQAHGTMLAQWVNVAVEQATIGTINARPVLSTASYRVAPATPVRHTTDTLSHSYLGPPASCILFLSPYSNLLDHLDYSLSTGLTSQSVKSVHRLRPLCLRVVGDTPLPLSFFTLPSAFPQPVHLILF